MKAGYSRNDLYRFRLKDETIEVTRNLLLPSQGLMREMLLGSRKDEAKSLKIRK